MLSARSSPRTTSVTPWSASSTTTRELVGPRAVGALAGRSRRPPRPRPAAARRAGGRSSGTARAGARHGGEAPGARRLAVQAVAAGAGVDALAVPLVRDARAAPAPCRCPCASSRRGRRGQRAAAGRAPAGSSAARCVCQTGGSSGTRPQAASCRRMTSPMPGRQRSVSASSMRTSQRACGPRARTSSQLASAATSEPACSGPVGEGANRPVRTSHPRSVRARRARARGPRGSASSTRWPGAPVAGQADARLGVPQVRLAQRHLGLRLGPAAGLRVARRGADAGDLGEGAQQLGFDARGVVAQVFLRPGGAGLQRPALDAGRGRAWTIRAPARPRGGACCAPRSIAGRGATWSAGWPAGRRSSASSRARCAPCSILLAQRRPTACRRPAARARGPAARPAARRRSRNTHAAQSSAPAVRSCQRCGVERIGLDLRHLRCRSPARRPAAAPSGRPARPCRAARPSAARARAGRLRPRGRAASSTRTRLALQGLHSRARFAAPARSADRAR